MKRNVAKAVFCAALGNILWGFSFLFTRLGLDVAGNPNLLLSHRFLFSTLCLSFMILIGKGSLSFKGKNLRPIFVLLAMQVCYYLFETYGLLYTNTTIAGLVLAVVPVVTIGTGVLFLREYPTRRQALFCIMPVAGVIIMTISGKELGVVTSLGIFLLLLTMLSSAVYKTANRKAAREFSPFERTYLVIGISALFFTVVALSALDWDLKAYAAPLVSPQYILSVVSLGLLCSITANILVNYASGILSVFQVSSFGSLCTLCSVLVGVIFLDEPMSIPLALGAVLILVGIRQVTKQQ